MTPVLGALTTTDIDAAITSAVTTGEGLAATAMAAVLGLMLTVKIIKKIANRAT